MIDFYSLISKGYIIKNGFIYTPRLKQIININRFAHMMVVRKIAND